ncbi:sugar ABC transporter ATP-binding protein [Stackebrandtia nassauensis]|uniref:ABC transporter related protein n=1 Tax=Stackebrandtia nassauensis (strain DSM 44728 / CIP 108903 / NRRL B-16338 / NBRC 102104 / LLR-40K-21) TaxID=446470 RepID=D3PXM6_STANL|nr:sugar ABC transporter ATP-binding protein [Stackebrandtia nassauensis]ADD43356.1 ABC transporter related protein [Stackebrandtia nassauensis DSM 44728]
MTTRPPGDPHDEPPLLELRDVSKTFGSIVALKSARLRVERGSIHALVGENGAGKSTLVKIVAGLHQRDDGSFRLDGEAVDFSSTAQSKAAGIAVIYQEPTLFPDLSVMENIFMGRQPLTRWRRVDRAAMRRRTRDLFQRLGVAIDPDRPAMGLSIADQQIIEIAKAISLDARLLIMDEPTAALSGIEVDRLFTIARALRDEGRGLVFISHRFNEIFDLCDRITVMRDGSYVATHDAADVTAAEVVNLMVGRPVETLYPKTEGGDVGEVVLRVDGLSRRGTFTDVSLTVRSGEIVGMAGLVGAGRSEVARAVFGVDDYDSGAVTVAGTPLRRGNPRAAIRAGLAFVPEDRRREGLLVEESVGRNIALVLRRKLANWGLIRRRDEDALAAGWARTLQITARDLDVAAGTLSGGNQQKAVIAKWMATDPRVLIIDEPTRGIDVGTKTEVHRLLDELAGRGLAILMISSDLPEILGMSDRVYVMSEGRITRELARDEATGEAVMTAATTLEAVR